MFFKNRAFEDETLDQLKVSKKIIVSCSRSIEIVLKYYFSRVKVTRMNSIRVKVFKRLILNVLYKQIGGSSLSPEQPLTAANCSFRKLVS